MTFICSCSDEDCAMFGCKRMREKLAQKFPDSVSMPMPQYQRFDPPPLTADDIRRIVREEIERLTKENNDVE